VYNVQECSYFVERRGFIKFFLIDRRWSVVFCDIERWLTYCVFFLGRIDRESSDGMAAKYALNSLRESCVWVGLTVPKSESAGIDGGVEIGLRLGLLALLGYWAWTVVAPLLTIFLWSAILTVALFPAYERLAVRLGSRGAASILTLLTLLVVVGPLVWLAAGLISGLGDLASGLQGGIVVPPPPDAVRRWPVIGEQFYELWRSAAMNLKTVLVELGPKLKPLAGQVVSMTQDAIVGLIQFLLAILISGFLFAPGPRLVEFLERAVERVLRPRGHDLVRLAGATVRNVSRGVIGVAFLQAVLVGIGFAAAGIKAPGVLAFVALMLGVIQVGPSIIIVPAIIWAWLSMETFHAMLFTAYMVPVGLIDNVLRPILMARGLATPMIVILVGVIGGTLSHGIVGLFFGPVITAVSWDLLSAWIEGRGSRDASDDKETPRER
jgi:predicted PurR-regulated permease PerM